METNKLFEQIPNLSEATKSHLITVLESSVEGFEKELNGEDVDWAIYAIPTETDEETNFFEKINDITIGGHYDTQDIIDLDNKIIKALKGDTYGEMLGWETWRDIKAWAEEHKFSNLAERLKLNNDCWLSSGEFGRSQVEICDSLRLATTEEEALELAQNFDEAFADNHGLY